LPEWTAELIAAKGLSIQPNALAILVDHIGNDLSRLKNEVEKITINLNNRKKITDADIENYVGVSKEFNVFELQDAISQKNLPKAIRIIQYFRANPKAGPLQLILPTLYNYFSKIYAAAAESNLSEAVLKPMFYNNPFAVKQAIVAINNYGYSGTEKILLLLHEYNLKNIGINNGGITDADLLKELAVKITSL